MKFSKGDRIRVFGLSRLFYGGCIGTVHSYDKLLPGTSEVVLVRLDGHGDCLVPFDETSLELSVLDTLGQI